jgi:hypothetical protein
VRKIVSDLKCPQRFSLPKKDQGCIKHECAWYQNVIGNHPQTGQPMNGWACAISWLPMLMIESAGAADRVTSATDKVATIIFSGMPKAAQDRILSENPSLRAMPAPTPPQIGNGKADA